MEIRQQFRVTMFDVDNAFIYFGAYIQWMDRGFQLYVKECGKTFIELIEEENLIFPVVDTHIRYYHPARLDDDVEVVTKIVEFGRSSITAHHQFYRMADQCLLADGTVKHVCTNSKKMKSVSLPEWIVRKDTP